MQKSKITITFFLFVFILLTFSCSKEDDISRTREQEWEELNTLIRKLEAGGVDVDTTALSVFFVVQKKSTGPFPSIGDTCTISYTGYYLPEGVIFENSKDIYPSDGKWRFIYKPQHKVPGFVDGIGYVNEGSEVDLYIHSDFGYGEEGTRGVPSYRTLYFRVTMHEIKPLKK